MSIVASVVLGGTVTAALVTLARRSAQRLRAHFALITPAAVPLAGGVTIAVALPAAHGNGGIAGIIVSCAACVSAFTDLQAGYIYDSVVTISAAIVVVRAAVSGTLLDTAMGALALSCAFGILWLSSKGRAIGLGDVKFAAVIGAAFGWQWGAVAIGAAFVTGGAMCIVLLICGCIGRGARVPLAPYLAAGCCIVTLAGGSLS